MLFSSCPMKLYLLSFLTPLFFSLLLTPCTALLAKRLGHIAYPAPRGWHQKPTPLFGGASILASFLLGFYLIAFQEGKPHIFVIGSILSFLLGLVDDLYSFKPHVKLLGQVCIALLVAPHHLGRITIIVMMMNSFNLLDNMDGLAGGIACITSITLALMGLLYHQPGITALALVLSGAVAGFLIYNFHPAKIFMGDCGSLFLGFLIAILSSSLMIPRLSTDLFSFFMIGFLLMAIPLLDTFSVICSRFKHRKSIIEGGKDHLSHRLISLGFSAPKAVLILYAATLLSNMLALLYVFRKPH